MEGTGSDSHESQCLTESLTRVAPEPLGRKFEPGDGFAARQGADWIPWEQASVTGNGRDGWEFVQNSAGGLRAVSSLRLDPDLQVAVYQTTLTNRLDAPCRPLTELCPLYLELGGIENPRILSCGGAGSSGGLIPVAKEYPPGSFRTRWIRPYAPIPVEFSSGGCSERATGSSTRNLPLVMLCEGADLNSPGMFFGLEWSTSWAGRVSLPTPANMSSGESGDRLHVVMGLGITDLVLEPGESLELPAVHVGFFEHGFESGTNACRRYIHRRLTPLYLGKPMVPPVNYSMWGGIEAPYTEEDLYPQVDAAAEIGVEMFMVDCDWYPGDYRTGLGNWEIDRGKFPSGMEAFSEYVRSRGMGLGLYFEAVARPGTRLAREHPELFYQLPPEFGLFKLNLGLPEACDYLIEMIGGFIERYDLRYVRADFGQDPTTFPGQLWAVKAFKDLKETFSWDLVDPTGKAQFAHVRGLYRVWETLTRKHPTLMLELNDGGGNMMDLGSLRRHHCAWSNDSLGNPHIARMVQLGGNTFMPANYMGAGVGPNQAGRGRGADAGFGDLSFLSRMTGELFLQSVIAAWPPEVKKRAKQWIGVFKRIRHLLVRDYYRLLPQPQSEEEWDAAQFCDGSGEGVIFVFRMTGSRSWQIVFPRALDRDMTYRFTNEADGAEEVIAAGRLLNEGLRVELEPDSAKLYSYRPDPGLVASG